MTVPVSRVELMSRFPVRRQGGFSLWGWLVVLALAGFFLTLGFRIGPVYVTNYTVRATVKSLQNEPELGALTPFDVRRAVERKFDVNRIEVIQAVCRDKKKPCMTIEKTKTEMTINANYETRVHAMGNIDAVIVFSDNMVTIPIPGGS